MPSRPLDRRDMRLEGRHIALASIAGSQVLIAVCGLCSALISIDDDGELRHLRFHEATRTIEH